MPLVGFTFSLLTDGRSGVAALAVLVAAAALHPRRGAGA